MNYPTEMQQKMDWAAAHATNSIIGAGVMAQSATSYNMHPQRDRSPADISAERLAERLLQLQAEVAQLVDRLAPISRPESTGECKASGRAPAECQLIDTLDGAAERIEQAINRLSNARERLCI